MTIAFILLPHPSQAQSSMLKLGWLYYQLSPPPTPPPPPNLFEPGSLKSDTLKPSALKGPTLDELWINFGPTLDQLWTNF